MCACEFLVPRLPTSHGAETGWDAIATPLRIVNLNPFHLLFGVPGSFGSRVLTPGSSELIASMDMASYLSAATPEPNGS